MFRLISSRYSPDQAIRVANELLPDSHSSAIHKHPDPRSRICEQRPWFTIFQSGTRESGRAFQYYYASLAKAPFYVHKNHLLIRLRRSFYHRMQHGFAATQAG